MTRRFNYIASILLVISASASADVTQTKEDQAEKLGRAVGAVLALHKIVNVIESTCGADARNIEAIWVERNKAVIDRATWIWTTGMDEVTKGTGENADQMRSEVDVAITKEVETLRTQINEMAPEQKTIVCQHFLETTNSGEWDVQNKSPEEYLFLQQPWEDIRP